MSSTGILPSSPKKPFKLGQEPWLNNNIPQVILCQGMRRSGKGYVIDWIAEQLHNDGILVLHIWGARSFENLYWAINKNCRTRWEEVIKNNPNAEVGLHCECFKAYPIVWVVPDYIEVNQESLDKFNRVYFKDKEEYKIFHRSGKVCDVFESSTDFTKIKKPKEFIPKQLIVVKKVIVPSTPQKTDIFREQFTKIVLDARLQHRIIVMNPQIFEGEMDKFKTLAAIVKMIPDLTTRHFKPLTEKEVGKPRSEWTVHQKSWHKICIVINELRSVAPSSKLSPQEESKSSKRAIFDMIPEARHFKTWFLGDYQNPDDLFAGIRYQANLVIIKRGSNKLLGDDWTFLFKKIEEEREKAITYYGGNYPQVVGYVDRFIPKIEELADNKGYVTDVNGDRLLITTSNLGFHHKNEMDDFSVDTGITWTVDRDSAQKGTSEESKKAEESSSKKTKTAKDDIMKKMDYMFRVEKKKTPEIKQILAIQEKEGLIPNFGYGEMSIKYLNQIYNRWKKKHETKEK